MAQHQDHYAVLGVAADATLDEIKRNYRRLALASHPDRHPGDVEAEERFRAISTAYAVLSDPAQRARYDAQRHLPVGLFDQPVTMQTARDLLAAVVGDVFGRQRRERRRGRDVRYTLTVDLAEAALGSEHEIQFEALGPCATCSGTGSKPGGRAPTSCPLCGGRGEVKGEGFLARHTTCGRCSGTGMVQLDPCETCRGRGARREARTFKVRLPAGTEGGAEKVIANHGEPGQFGGGPGNLRVTVSVRPHAWLRREGQDIHCELFVSPLEAARGGKVPVPTLTGSALLELPPGVATGAKLRLRGKGVPSEGGRPGDQLVTVVVETANLSAGTGAVGAALEGLERALQAEPQALPKRAAQRGLK
ncbi:DnaJ C-terminal domain-containing protein [Nannocystis pusilla]|uniref:DnaJ C-terminal domain-containing protein n=1 Tax=Nannocystis pusilla TaxID=889268 RepID=UPI003BF1A9DF